MHPQDITTWLVDKTAAILQISPHNIDPAQPFASLGMDSMMMLELTGDLAAWLGHELSPSLVWEHPTIYALAAHLSSGLALQEPPIVPVGRDIPLPQTFAQERMWRAIMNGGPDARQIVSKGVKLQGDSLDIPLLDKCLVQLVERHEPLRATFGEHDGHPIQISHPAPHTLLRVQDLSASPDAEDSAWSDFLADKRRPYDLATGPLVQCTLYILGEHDYRLGLHLHHIICDGHTFAIILQELSFLYQQTQSGTQISLPPMSVQTGDFATWQRHWLRPDGPAYAAHLAWWNDFLGTQSPAPACATLRWAQPPAVPDPGQISTMQTLPNDLCDRLRDIAVREGSTFANLVLAAFMVALARRHTPEGALVGSYVSDRRRPAVMNLMGHFVNLIVIRMTSHMDRPFLDVLRHVSDTMTQVSAHQDFPFENLAEARAAAGLYAPHPQVIFNYRPEVQYPDPFFRGVHLSDWMYRQPAAGIPWGMTGSTLHTPEGLLLKIHFDTGLYEPARVQALKDDFVAILKSAASL
ncbi:MAG: condensation domain-containing protein [Verrucomicrobium sp.]